MAILIVEHNGNLEGASLSGRVLIGRRASNHVVVDDPAVSRIHAWIDTADRQFCITDAGSRTGTFVNGQRVGATKVMLHHGDRITVGPASLIFRTDSTLPAGVSQLNFEDNKPAVAAPAVAETAGTGVETSATPAAVPELDGGILFDCSCGAPLWISAEFAGRLGRCRFCGTIVRVPQLAGATVTDTATPARPATPPASVPPQADACGICQSPIGPGESSTTCPSCGLTFHADCWTENFGCSAYGCAQVNVLLPRPDSASSDSIAPTAANETALPDIDTAPPPRIPPKHALLAGSVAGLLLGALTFGVPALLALVATLVYIKRRGTGDRRSRGVLWAAIVLSVVGVAVGAVVSYIWWLAGSAPVRGVDGLGVWSHSR